jgi:YD repeat-containing protein
MLLNTNKKYENGYTVTAYHNGEFISITKYDKYDNMIYEKLSNGTERHQKYEYDMYGNITYFEDYNGLRIKHYYHYDGHGNITYDNLVCLTSGNDVYTHKYEYSYDKYGNIIYEEYIEVEYYKNITKSTSYYAYYPDGSYAKTEVNNEKCICLTIYDKYGNIVYKTNRYIDTTFKYTYEYDDHGNITYAYPDYDECEGFACANEYNNNGDLVYCKQQKYSGDIYEYHYTYDDEPVITKQNKPKRKTITVGVHKDGNYMKYDSRGNKIYEKYPNGNEYHYKYDDHGNMIYTKYPDGNEYHYKYDNHGMTSVCVKYPDGR